MRPETPARFHQPHAGYSRAVTYADRALEEPHRPHHVPVRTVRQRYPWLDRLARAGTRYVEFHGYHYAASVTYFSVLSLVPMVMVVVAVTGFVLTGQPALFVQLRHAVVDHRVKIGVFGLLVGLYSGWNWINALRDALAAMWKQERRPQRLVPMVLKDLLALLGLAGALIVSFALTVLGSYLPRLPGWLDAPAVVLADARRRVDRRRTAEPHRYPNAVDRRRVPA